MIIYPAIDLRAGNCVRLYQGDYAKETVYSDSAIDTAKRFLKAGAKWLHLVDLDGAKNPKASQASRIKKLLQTVPLQIQVGGGIRTRQHIDAYFDSGAARVVLGSLLIQSPKTVLGWLKQYKAEKFTLALDVFIENNIPWIATEAWQKLNRIKAFDLIAPFVDQGVEHVLCTDIQKDGVGSGPNLALYQELLSQFPRLKLQASGGIHSIKDILLLKDLGLAGAISGRALYEQTIHLSEALKCLQ